MMIGLSGVGGQYMGAKMDMGRAIRMGLVQEVCGRQGHEEGNKDDLGS